MSVLLDTSILIDVQRRYPPALTWLDRVGRTPLHISTVTITELARGVDTVAGERALEALVQSLIVISVDAKIARTAAAILRRHDRSLRVGLADALIGATSAVSRLPLITRNVRHFPSISARSPY